nr:hypothetical protein [Polyangiaceae bacterium]
DEGSRDGASGEETGASGAIGASDAAGKCDPAVPVKCALPDGSRGEVACDNGRPGECLPVACSYNETLACRTSGGAPGARLCDSAPGGPVWSECAPFLDCEPGDSFVCQYSPGTSFCMLSSEGWAYNLSSCNTPLVLSFDNAPVDFTRPAGFFDLVGAGASFATDWVSASTPWLAIDLDGNGSVDDGRELFGSMSALPSGQRATNGFVALAALDDNGDGVISAADASWPKLLLWRDHDQDRRSSSRELRPAADDGLVAIALAYRSDRPRCTGTACEIERASFRFRDAAGRERTGTVVDVHFDAR